MDIRIPFLFKEPGTNAHCQSVLVCTELGHSTYVPWSGGVDLYQMLEGHLMDSVSFLIIMGLVLILLALDWSIRSESNKNNKE